ncbi:hypothetical protein MBLNU457_g0889t1 [Dothideomycetes sp. NU457]
MPGRAMDQSFTLINAQVQFLDTRLGLIHIPLPLYPQFIQPILKLLALTGKDGENEDGELVRPWQFAFPFANVSVTSVECSIVCPRHLVTELFVPVLNKLEQRYRDQVSISRDDFVVIQVGGEGQEAGQRVLDLTAPLALAGISIFFITTYTSDYILVPQRSRNEVIKALETRGFAFQSVGNGHSQMTNISSPLLQHSHSRNASAHYFDTPRTPTTPPPTTIPELLTKTFNTLRKNNIVPQVDRSMLVQNCAGHRKDITTQSLLVHYITCCLISSPPPRFLALTLTDTDPISLTLEQSLLEHFPNKGANILLSADELVVPIMLDLRGLPEESTGIVCGVAGRLIASMGGKLGGGFNMSYLSTFRAGNVIVREDEVDEAMEALRGFQNVAVRGWENEDFSPRQNALKRMDSRELTEGLEGMSL